MAYAMDRRESAVWELHSSGKTIAEVARAARMRPAEAHGIIVYLWRMQKMHDGLEAPKAKGGGDGGERR